MPMPEDCLHPLRTDLQLSRFSICVTRKAFEIAPTARRCVSLLRQTVVAALKNLSTYPITIPTYLSVLRSSRVSPSLSRTYTPLAPTNSSRKGFRTPTGPDDHLSPSRTYRNLKHDTPVEQSDMTWRTRVICRYAHQLSACVL